MTVRPPRRCETALVAAALAALAACPTVAAAQERPTATVHTTTERIVIDGRLDEPAWQQAPVHSGFVERQPKLRRKPTARTYFRVLQDSQALYFGIECHDEEPQSVRARTRTRDDFALFRDDAISIKIDPRLDGRTTIGFALNAASGRLDYRGVNESDFLVEHDAFWKGAGRRTEQGWSAEVRIPLRELGIDPGSPPETIGLNLSRDHSRRNATYDWSLMPPPFSAIAASRYGRLTGLKRVGDGEDAGSKPQLMLQPYALSGYQAQRGEDGQLAHDAILNAGGDVMLSYGRLFGQLTFNTDFAQVDLDNQVVNLTRFGLFLPEKRRFFLRDLELLQFGRPQQNQMFYSRRIGLDDSAGPVPILAGVKLAAQPHDNVRVAVVQATTRPSGDIPWTSYAAARGVVDVGGGSNAGLMVTNRQSLVETGDRNLVVGADGTWRGGAELPIVAQLYAMGSVTGPAAGQAQSATGGDAGGEDADRFAPAVGASVSLRDLLWRPSLAYTYLHPALRNDMGFIQRVGIHQTDASFGVEPRLGHDGLEKFRVTASGQVVADASGDPERDQLLDWRATVDAQLRWDAGYFLGFTTSRRFEAVQTPFDVGRRTQIADEDYLAWVVSVYGGTPGQKVVSGSATLTARDYYGGSLHEIMASLSLQPSSLFRFDVSGIYDYVRFAELPGFDSLVLNGQLVLGFTSKLGMSVYTGYNLLRDQLQVQSRLRWTYGYGSDLFLVQQLNLNDDSGLPTFYSLLAKSSFRWAL